MNRRWELNKDRNHSDSKAKFYSNGLVCNLPSTMIPDQFGLAALVIGQKANLQCSLPDTIAKDVLAEVTNEMTPQNSNDAWVGNFSGPFMKPSEPSAFTAEPEILSPMYLVTSRQLDENPTMSAESIRKSFALKVDKFGDDLLFFIFYSFPQDVLQLVAAHRLFAKGWRYHMNAQIWLHRLDTSLYTKEVDRSTGAVLERGVYNYFNSNAWRVCQFTGVIDCCRLEGPPAIPASMDLIFTGANNVKA